MKRLFRIDESEKNRILGMHKSATSRQYLKEQENDATDQADAGEETSQETTTDQASSQETYSCDKVEEYLNDEGVKKWIKAIKDNKSEIMKGSEQNEKNPTYKGVKKVIAIIQCKLEELNLNPGTIDGIFGNNTKKAVEAFQMKEFNKKDGIVGDETWTKMFPEPSETEETPSANECYMNFGEEGTMLRLYENNAKAARKKDNKNFIFFEDGTVIIWEGNQPMGGREQDATYQWRCNGDDVEFFKKFDF